jgi:TP901 family phage tail tape measure protein
MSRDLRATAILDARDNTGAAFDSARRRLAALEGRMKTFNTAQAALARSSGGVMSRAESTMRGVGGTLLAGGGALAAYGVTRYASNAVKRYADVERALTRIAVTSDATDAEISGGIERMRNLAQETAQPFDEMRKGMDDLTASGKSFRDSLAMMPAIARVAQASGSTIADAARTTTAMVDNMNLPIEKLGEAYDSLAKQGKMGRFEFKDMAQHFPSLLPAAERAGFRGLEGIQRVGALLQTIRPGTGSSSQAATSLENVFQKMETEETVKKFEKVGRVDLRKEMDQARKMKRDLFETFLDATSRALKGDLSKLPQLFQDAEVLRGITPLIKNRLDIKKFLDGAQGADGTVAADLNRVLKDKQAEIDRFKDAWDRFTTAVGGGLAQMSSAAGITRFMQDSAAILEGKKGGESTVGGRLHAHRRLSTAGPLSSALDDEKAIEARIVALRDRIRKDPAFAGRHDVGARVAQYRDQLFTARERSNVVAQGAMPRLDGAGNVYGVDGLAIESWFKQQSRDGGFHLQNPAGVSRGLDEAVRQSQQAAVDIEAALREIDLAGAGQLSGASFKTGLVNELRQAEAETLTIVGRIKQALSFSASPNVRVSPGGLNQGQSKAGADAIPQGVP